MNKQIIESVGVSGVSIEFNHSELVVLKGFVAQLKKLDTEHKDNSYNFSKAGKPMVKDMIVFIEKMLPELTMSIEEAYAELFTLPVVPEIVVHEEELES